MEKGNHNTIDPRPAGELRPRWSIMVPTYNCASYLRYTLESILVQDRGAQEMQIEVIDDCSMRDDPAAVVQEVGKGRVTFHRQETNQGHTGNFITCLRRARGEFVHILHGDDMVRPGFYDTMEGGFLANAEVGAVFCRTIFANERGQWVGISPLEGIERGVVPDAARVLASRQRIQTSSIVVRRSVYEHLGGFDRNLSFTEDWEMWVRIACHYKVWFEPDALGVYRAHAGSSTAWHTLSGANIRDVRKCIAIFVSHFPLEQRKEIRRQALKSCALHALRTATQLLDNRQANAGFVQLREAWNSCPGLWLAGHFAHELAGVAFRVAYRRGRKLVRTA